MLPDKVEGRYYELSAVQPSGWTVAYSDVTFTSVFQISCGLLT